MFECRRENPWDDTIREQPAIRKNPKVHYDITEIKNSASGNSYRCQGCKKQWKDIQ